MEMDGMVNHLYQITKFVVSLFILSINCSLVLLELKLGAEELERWFTKIDHVFEHTRIPPVGEVLTLFYKTTVKKLQHYDLPLVSHVNHK
jgi:hypothetical protein